MTKEQGPGLFSYLRPHRHRIALAFGAMLFLALFTGMFTLIIQPLMDELFFQRMGNGSGTGYLTRKSESIRNLILSLFGQREDRLGVFLPQLLFLAFLGQAVFTFFSQYTMKVLGLRVARQIRDTYFVHLMGQNHGSSHCASTGDLISRITNDLDRIRYVFSETLGVMGRESLSLLALLAVVFYQDWVMAVLSFIIVPVAASLLVILGKRVKRQGIRSQEMLGKLSGFLAEKIQGLRIVKAYNMEEAEGADFARINEEHFHINSKIEFVFSFASPIMHTIGGLVAATIFTLGMSRIARGHMTPGQFNSFLAALFMMYNPLKRLSQVSNDWHLARAAHERIRQILTQPLETVENPEARELEAVAGHLVFEDVHFAYSGRARALDGINLDVPAGQTVALVGESGAGKTTLTNLVLRLMDPQTGRILLDGVDLRDVTLKSLRARMGLVSQDVVLFSGSVLENITYGASGWTWDEVKRAARLARAEGFVEALPDGYHTPVGEGGRNLSAGQRQRISIARAILRNPSIWILDEATSALDTESEHLIQEAINEVTAQRTTLIVAHRLSTIRHADKIVVMKEGRIVEQGTHLDLMKAKGLYHSLFTLQFPTTDPIIPR